MNQSFVLLPSVSENFIATLPTLSVVSHCKKPTAQTAHLVFADTQANKKPKELFFANA